MAPPEKRIRKCITKPQLEIIVETMESNVKLNKGLVNSRYTCEEKLEDWKNLVKKLNAAGGAVKTLEKWQKVSISVCFCLIFNYLSSFPFLKDTNQLLNRYIYCFATRAELDLLCV